MVDVTSVVDLAHAFVPAVLERSPGAAISNVASTAAFQPVPYMAVYGASKAFVLSFSQALAEEFRARGLRALERGSSVVIDGPFNTLVTQLIRFFPWRFIAHMAGLSVRPRQMPGAT